MTLGYALFSLGAMFLYSAVTNTPIRNLILGIPASGQPTDILARGLAGVSGRTGGSARHSTAGGSSRYKGVTVCNWIIDVIKQAERDVGPLQPTSGVRHGRDPHTRSGQTEHSGCTGHGGAGSGAVDFGGYGGSPDADKFRHWLAQNGNPMRGGESYGDMGHFSKDGH